MTADDRTRDELLAEIADLRARVQAFETMHSDAINASLQEWLFELRRRAVGVSTRAKLIARIIGEDAFAEATHRLVMEQQEASFELQEFVYRTPHTYLDNLRARLGFDPPSTFKEQSTDE